ncbi:phage major capsid protein [Devosia beringensis]|uniref:phage major capsid protein n=1 Tax=Devosia beringensis TaxID=2657486 RepID=UPI00186B5A64|nr:phage major capsid protein [Devosia beringensis]
MKHFSPPALLARSTALVTPRAIASLQIRADATDPKALIDALNRSFEEFKAAHDQKLKAKVDDVVLNEKIDKINLSVGDFQKAIDDLNAKLAAAELGAGTAQVRDPGYTKAFAAHVRKGELRDHDLQASLNKGAASEGGYTAPIEWDRTITDRLVILSAMRQIASIQTIGGAGFSKLFNNRGTGSGWVGETAARPETTTPTLGTLNYALGEIYANPSVTQGLLDDSEVDIEAWLADNVETEFAYQEGIAFVSGNGTNKPNGFLTYATGAANAAAHPWGAITATTVVGTTAVTSDELLALTYSLPQAYSDAARWVLNRLSLGKIRALKDGQGNYLWQPSYQAGEPATLLNFPVTEMAAMPNMTTGALPIAFGDFKRGYLIIDRVGVRVLRDPFTNKPYVMFYTTKRVGGGLLNPDTIKVLKMA